jgi:hypothetical protein
MKSPADDISTNLCLPPLKWPAKKTEEYKKRCGVRGKKNTFLLKRKTDPSLTLRMTARCTVWPRSPLKKLAMYRVWYMVIPVLA